MERFTVEEGKFYYVYDNEEKVIIDNALDYVGDSKALSEMEEVKKREDKRINSTVD